MKNIITEIISIIITINPKTAISHTRAWLSLFNKIRLFIYNKLKSINFRTQEQQNDDSTFVPLNQAIDMFIEHEIWGHPNFTNSRITARILDNSESQIINRPLSLLLEYVKDKKIILYGQRTKTINNIREVNEDFTDFITFYYKKNWSDDYSSVYDNGELLYTDLKFKKSDLDSFIQQYKLPPRKSFTLQHIT